MDRIINYYNKFARLLDVPEAYNAKNLLHGCIGVGAVFIALVFSVVYDLNDFDPQSFVQFMTMCLYVLCTCLWFTIPPYIAYRVLYKLAEKYDRGDEDD